MSIQNISGFLKFKTWLVSVIHKIHKKFIIKKCLISEEEDVDATHLIGEVYIIGCEKNNLSP